jgi:hypothetical protein
VSSRLRRLGVGILLVMLAMLAIVTAAVAGAATAPQRAPPVAIPAPPAVEGPPDVVAPPRRHVVRGAVLMVREDRLALMVEGGEKPIMVAARPATAVRLNTQKAEFADLQRGDQAIVVGKSGPRGNMIAKAIVAVRSPAAAPTT